MLIDKSCKTCEFCFPHSRKFYDNELVPDVLKKDENFLSVYKQWKANDIKTSKAVSLSGLSKYMFDKRVKEYEESVVISEETIEICTSENYGEEITDYDSQRTCWEIDMTYHNKLLDLLPEKLRARYLYDPHFQLNLVSYFESQD